MAEVARTGEQAIGSRSKTVRRNVISQRAVFDSITGYAIITLAADATISNWNPGASRIFGYCSDDMIGQPFATLFGKDDVAAGKPAAELRRARESGGADFEGWLRRSAAAAYGPPKPCSPYATQAQPGRVS